MKILLDPQIFIQKYGGISRYYAELWRIIQNDVASAEVSCPMIFSDNLHISEYDLQPHFFPSSIEKIISNNNLLKKGVHGVNGLLTLKSIYNNNFDVFIPTYYYPYFLKYIKKPFVLTVYDMIFEIYPNYFKADAKIEHKKILMEKASKIIAISENTKQDILRIYPHIEESKIEVVHLSHSIDLSIKKNDIENLPSRYLLFIGNRNLYKNFNIVLEAVKDLIKKDNSLYIICGGGGKFNEHEKYIINKLGLAQNVIQIDFKDNQLSSLYRNAISFIFPSEYEGFGIPVLESMASGCPVILTNRSSFPEVAGDAGIYFENNNSVDLQTQIIKVMGDQIYRESMIKKSLIRAQQFTWNKTIEHCLRVYQSVI